MLFCIKPSKEEEYLVLRNNEELPDSSDCEEAYENSANSTLLYQQQQQLVRVSGDQQCSPNVLRPDQTQLKVSTPRTFRKLNSSSPSTPAVKAIASDTPILSKLGSGLIRRNKLSKDTEHLQKEALRKSTEAAANYVDGAQRYIKLPSSSHSKQLSCEDPKSAKSTSVASSVNSSKSPSAENALQGPVPVCKPHRSPLTSRQPRTLSAQSSPSVPPVPSLLPRSANNPPPRPKTNKPLRDIMPKTEPKPPSAISNGGLATSVTDSLSCPAPAASSSATGSSNSSAGAPPSGSSSSQAQHHHQQLINKPPRGWLHPDYKLSDSSLGVTYSVRVSLRRGWTDSRRSQSISNRTLASLPHILGRSFERPVVASSLWPCTN